MLTTSNLAKHIAGILVIAIAIATVTPSLTYAWQQCQNIESEYSNSLSAFLSESALETEFVLPDSDIRLYTAEEIQQLNDYELFVAINEMYARHGRIFTDPDLSQYFESLSWYSPQFSPEEYEASAPSFSETEQGNLETLVNERSNRGL